MALRKSDLYRSLWRGCDELRGGMDAGQYQDYILTLLFVKYGTDKAAVDRAGAGGPVQVPPEGSFDRLAEAKGRPDIGARINAAVGALARANGLENVIDLADFHDEEKLGRGREMRDRLTRLVTVFEDLEFRGSRAEGDDLLGDAYEYLMRQFATESGRSKGQFYTPAEVSRVLAKVVGIGPATRPEHTVYDPTCGSGSLLLKVADEAPRGVTLFGQEKDTATWALARMNMYLHGNPAARIAKGDAITGPRFTAGDRLMTFDFAVANPPFSVKSWTSGLDREYGRFSYGRPPEKNGDYAFLLHVLASLKSTGKAAVILPHGVLYRGDAEGAIRRELIEHGLIKGIIGLPANLFYGTSIPACIVLLDKQDAHARDGVFLIDAARGFRKDGTKNRLRGLDEHRIVDVFTRRLEIDGYSRLVPYAEIARAGNDYNLNLARYLDSAEPADVHDLDAHLHGGIPQRDVDALAGYWDAFPQLRATLFEPRRPGYLHLAVEVPRVRPAALDSIEFQKLGTAVRGQADDWFAAHRPALAAVTADTVPGELIATIAEDLLRRFRPTPLLDEYDVYQQLMTYWQETMHDDVVLVMNDGWAGAARPRRARATGYDRNGKPKFEDAHIVLGSRAHTERYVLDLIPPELVVARFLPAERAEVDARSAAAGRTARELAAFLGEHAGEDGPLADAVDDDRVTPASATAARTRASDPGTAAALAEVVALFAADAAAKRAWRAAQAALDRRTVAVYEHLTADEVRGLVLDDKWHATLRDRIARETRALVVALVARVQQLGERYAETLDQLDDRAGGAAGADLLRGVRRLPGFTAPWRQVHLGDHVRFVKTVPLTRAQLDHESPLRYLHYGDIHTGTSVHLDAARAVMPRVDPALAGNAGRLRVGDLVFADASEDPAGVGRSVELVSVPDGGVVSGLHTIAARFDPSVLADGYKGYLQFIPAFREALLRLAAGTKVLATTRASIASITLALPEPAEQRAIAAALTGADRAVAIAQRRLEKLRSIQLATMQTLLSTGTPGPRA
jgi:type I restriction enzyme M protein